MSPKYLRDFLSKTPKADKSSNASKPLCYHVFELCLLSFRYDNIRKQLVQKFAAQIKFVSYNRFVVHVLTSIVF